MLCVKEGIFYLKKESPDYKIFSNTQKDKFLGVYYNLIEESFESFYNEIKELRGKKFIYMFSLDNQVDKSPFAK